MDEEIMKIKLLAVALFMLISISFSQALELTFKADNVKDYEITSQTFLVDGYRRVYADIPVDRYDFAEIILDLELNGNLTGKGFVVYDSKYTGMVDIDIKNQKIALLHNPSDFDSRVELQFFGKGEVEIKSSVKILNPDYRFDGENYISYLFVKDFSSDTGFKSELKVFSKTDIDSVSYSVLLRYFGHEVYSKSKSITSTKFSKGKLNSIEIEIPNKYFISPGIYTVVVKSDKWVYERNYFVSPGINTIILFVTIFFGSYIAYKYRKEIYDGFLKLSAGQKFVLFAIVLLTLSAVILAFDDDVKANSIAILSYFFLVVGVGNLVFEYLLEDRGYKDYSSLRILIGFVVLSIFTHYTYDILKVLPYLDIFFLLIALVSGLKLVKNLI